jgi:transglutaminase-like putative cysteine protease
MGVAVVLAVAFDLRVKHASRGFALSGAVGTALGLVNGLLAPPWSPYMPAPVLGALCGAMASLATYCAYSRSHLYAGIYAWLLVVLSSYVPGAPVGLFAALAVMAASTIVSAVAESRVLGAGPGPAVVGLAAFVGLLLPGAYGLSRLAEASVDPVLGLVMRLTQKAPRLHGVGMEEEIRLRRISLVGDDDQVLFEVGGQVPLRLRTQVFDRFDGETWRTSRELSELHPSLAGTSERKTELAFSEELGPFLPAPGGTAAVDGVPVQTEGGGVLRAQAPLRGRTLRVSYGSGEPNPPEPRADPGLLALPDALRLELEPLARQIVGDAASARARATAIERFFSDNFEYSLLTDLSGPGHPLVRLIRERRPAYCIYFASATAALLRSLGMPARVVAGFVPGDVNRFTGRSIVRARDAHAWVEAFLPEEGRFVALDPTPWRSRDALHPPPTWASSALEALTSGLRHLYLTLGGSPGQVVLTLARSPLGWSLVVAYALWRFVRARRKGSSSQMRGALEAKDEVLRRAHASYLRLLQRRAGVRPLPHETDEEILQRVRRETGEAAAEAAVRFIEHYRRARYDPAAAGERSWEPELRRFEQALQKVSR